MGVVQLVLLQLEKSSVCASVALIPTRKQASAAGSAWWVIPTILSVLHHIPHRRRAGARQPTHKPFIQDTV
jgi:hypothetical protein